jgi:coenzyme F420-reducing hydrogenase gamma subunit
VSKRRPKLAVYKFASCDGCQLSLLDCEDELLAVAGEIEIAHFLEASRRVAKGPYDLALVEGSIATAHDAARIQELRRTAKKLVTIGACATAGGVQALRNFRDAGALTQLVYARPEFVDTLATSTPIAAHVKVDFELRGCPIDKYQLLEVIAAMLADRRPRIASHPLCLDCKRAGIACVIVAHGTPCLGPVTHTGCGVLCPRHGRGCYGCFGPADTCATGTLEPVLAATGLESDAIGRLYSTFNAAAPGFREAHERRRLPVIREGGDG